MDRGAWRVTVHGVTESDTTQQVNNNSIPFIPLYIHTHTHTHTHTHIHGTSLSIHLLMET